MINLILEIPYSHQIEKFDEAILGPWFESLKNAVKDISLESSQLDARTWRLHFPHIRASHIDLAVQGIKKAWETMKAWQEKIVVFHGFIVDADDFPTVLESFARLRRDAPRQNRFWADSSSRQVLNRAFGFEESEPGLHQIITFPSDEKLTRTPLSYLEEATVDWFTSARQNSLLAVECRLEEGIGVLGQLAAAGIGVLDNETVFTLYCREGDTGLHSVLRALRRWVAAADRSAGDGHGGGAELGWILAGSNEPGGIGVEPEDLVPRIYQLCLRNFARTFLGRIRTLVLVAPSNLDEVGREFLEEFLSAFRPAEKPVRVLVLDSDRQLLDGVVDWAGFPESRLTSCTASGETFERRMLELDEPERILLDICQMADGFLEHEEVCQIAELEGINSLLVPGLLGKLHERMFIPDPDLALLVHKRNAQASVQRACAQHIYQAWLRGERVLTEKQIQLICSQIEDLQGLLRLGYQLVFSGNTAVLERYSSAFAIRAPGNRQENEAAARLFAAELALLRGKFREAEKGLVALEKSDTGSQSGLLDGYKRLLAAKLEYSSGRLDTLIQEVKPAILTFQDLEEGFAVFMGNVVYGFAVFAKGRLQEAKEYFQIATHEAENVGQRWLVRIAGLFESLALSALGYHSRVLSNYGQERDSSLLLYESGLTRWARYSGFMEARTRFLLGDYSEAMESFSSLQQRFALWPGNELFADKSLEDKRWIGLFEVWAHRSRGFIAEAAGRPLHVSVPERETPADFLEASYFTAEALMLAGEFDKALQQLEREDRKPAASRVLFYPQPESGFQLFEDLYTGVGADSPVLNNLREALGAYVSARSGKLGEGAQRLFALSRDRSIGASDSYLHWYLSWYEDTLERLKNTEWEASTEDHNTILGKAIKAMQEKSSHIEDPGHRRFFLQNEYISRNLIRRGRQNNLI